MPPMSMPAFFDYSMRLYALRQRRTATLFSFRFSLFRCLDAAAAARCFSADADDEPMLMPR